MYVLYVLYVCISVHTVLYIHTAENTQLLCSLWKTALCSQDQTSPDLIRSAQPSRSDERPRSLIDRWNATSVWHARLMNSDCASDS